MKETAGGVTKEYTYLGGDAYHAPVVAVTQSGATTYYYLLRDYLGNITHIANNDGSLKSEYSYDAWGRQRNPSDWTNYPVGSEPDLYMGRGFTGHEHLPWFNLINMNGRLYDPIVGHFISPDPYVQMPNMTQSMNRYTYCMNNPLLYVDYNGYTWFTQLGNWLGNNGKVIVAIAVTIAVSAAVVATCGALAPALGPLAVSAIAGAISGAAGGVLGTAFSGGSGSDYWHAGINGLASGAVSGLIGGAVGKLAVKGLQNWGINGINSPLLKSALAGGVAGSIGGAAAGFGSELLMSGGDINAALGAAKSGFIFGAAIGTVAGAYSGYKQAMAQGIDPWTGKSNEVPNEVEITKSRFGHTFENHGEDATDFLTKRASGSGNAQGQFLYDQAAASFINENISSTANGTIDIPMPESFPARVINPNGTYASPTHIRLVPGGNGVKTAYPLIKY